MNKATGQLESTKQLAARLKRIYRQNLREVMREALKVLGPKFQQPRRKPRHQR